MTATTRIEYTGNIQVHHPLSITELRALLADATELTLKAQGVTEQARMRGIVAGAE